MHTMRKLFALMMVALLALSLAFAAVSCGQKAEEAPAATEQTPAPTETMTDTTMGGAATDTMAADTAAAH